MTEQKHINNMTRKEFLAVPDREDYRKPIVCKSIVIIPMASKHESGYHSITVVACDDYYPICKVTTFSDSLKLANFKWNLLVETPIENMLERWRIDSLPKSRLLHIWGDKSFTIGAAGSDLEIKGYQS